MANFLSNLAAFGTGAMEGYERSEARKLKQKQAKLMDDYRQLQIDTLKSQREAEQGGAGALMKTIEGIGGAPGAQGVQPQMQPGQPSQPMAQGGMPRFQVMDLIRQEAIKRGIDPNVALRVAQSEGLGKYTGDAGSSFGPFQLHYGGVAPGGNRVSGLGDVFTKQTGLDARDPRTVPQQVAFALDQAKQGGWGPWHGWKGDPRAGLPGGGQGGAPQQPQQPQQGPQLAQQGGDWRQFAQKIIQSNPGITPQAFMSALQSAQPFMNQESRMQVQALNLQLREQQLAERERHARVMEEQGAEKTETGKGRLKLQERGLEERKREFDAREGRLWTSLNSKLDQAEQRISQAKTRAEQIAAAKELDQALREYSTNANNLTRSAQVPGATGRDLVKTFQQRMNEAQQRVDSIKMKMRQPAPDEAPATGGGKTAAQPSLDEIWGK